MFRLRQHNGEIKNGARSTSMKRPWRHYAVVRGFVTKKDALSFEWHWKHSRKSKLLCDAVKGHSVVGVKGRRWVLDRMLKIDPWQDMDLLVEDFR